MAISLNKIFERRKKIRILTVLCFFVLLFYAYLLISQNPRGTKAAATQWDTAGNILTIGSDCNNSTISLISVPISIDPNGWEVDFDCGGGGLNTYITSGKSVIIDGAIVIASAPSGQTLDFVNLTIKNNGELTHSRFSSGENAATSEKIVNLTLSGTLTLNSGGKIDVSGKGYSGGLGEANGALRNGTSINGGGTYGYNPTLSGGGCGGGGAFFGDGGTPACASAGGFNGAGGQRYTTAQPIDQPNSLQAGSGGGGGFNRVGSAAQGGYGGGRVYVKAADSIQILDNFSYIYANGAVGEVPSDRTSGGGGGAGGLIWLDTPKLKYFSGYTGNPNLAGGTGGTPGAGLCFTNGSLGCAGMSNFTIGQISAAGGNGAATSYGTSGGGGGGLLNIKNLTGIEEACTINPDVTSGKIPASCENKDVIIDASTSTRKDVDAGAIKIWQKPSPNAGSECFDANAADTLCDSKRHFASLTLKNGAVLTHSAIGTNVASATASTGTIRWRKVDVETSGNLTMADGGNIDVTGAGYLGGRFTSCNNDNYTANEAYGQGRGAGHAADGVAYGDGAGFGGSGQAGQGTGGISYDSPNPPSILEAGSGGGYAYGHEWTGGLFGKNNWNCRNGGNGGGRVRLLIAGTIIYNDVNSFIKANGTNETFYGGDREIGAFGGDGSGGAIWIETNQVEYTYPADGTFDALSASGGTSGAGSGEILTEGFSEDNAFYNIYAKGGNGGIGGGGGRITIQKIDYYPKASVKKTLTAVERPADTPNASFNPYALQKGDVIGVKLEVEGVGAGNIYTLQDEWLKTLSGLMRCSPRWDTVFPQATNCSATNCSDPLVWNRIDVIEINYQCEVQGGP